MPTKELRKTDENDREWVLVSWSDDDVGIDPSRNLIKEDEDGNRYALMYIDHENVSGRFLTQVYPRFTRAVPRSLSHSMARVAGGFIA